jgi:hypothetical protein
MAVLLGKLANEFASRAARCERAFDGSLTPEARAYALVRLYAEWEEFSRRLVYVSATRTPITESGAMVPRAAGVRTPGDVHRQICILYRKRPTQNFTVAWGTPYQMVKICSHLGLGNESTINPAIQSTNSPANELRLLRNFLAHRNPSTALQVAPRPGLRTVGVDKVLQWLAGKQPGGRSLFGVWCGDLMDVARATVQ